MYLIKSGELAVFVGGMEEKHQVATMHKGEIVRVSPFLHCSLPHACLNRSDILGIQVGERALLLQEVRSATVRATKSTTLVSCPLSFSLVNPSDNGMSQFRFS